jgi:hypothetical protein
VRGVAAAVDEVVVPADDGLAHQHGGRDQARLAGRAPADLRCDTENRRGRDGMQRVRRAHQLHRPRRQHRHGGQYRPGGA